MERKKVYEIIDRERDFQDMLARKGRFEKEIHTVGEEILMMKTYLDKAAFAYTENYGSNATLVTLRKIVAMGIRCMENHGVPEGINIHT